VHTYDFSIQDPQTGRAFGVRADRVGSTSFEEVIVVGGGWISSRENRQLQIGTRRLAERFPWKTVLYMESPGVGGSDWDLQFVDAHWPFRSREMIRSGFGFSATQAARALHALGVRKVDFVGFSMGSNVLAKVALEAKGLMEVGHFVNVAGVLRHWSPNALRKEFTGPQSVEEHQAIRTDSPDPQVRTATETERELVRQGAKDILPWVLSGSRSKAGLMIRYMLMLSKPELREDLARLSGITKVISLVGENDRITDAPTYRGFPDAEVLAGLNHANLTSDPSIYVPLVGERLK